MVTISSLSELNCSMPPKVLKKFNANKNNFQMMPDAATKALQLVKDPACDLALVAKTIEKDVKLTSSIMTIANSPIYSPGRPIKCVREAILHVGLRQCQTLIQSCCAKSLMDSLDIDRQIGETIMQHCLLTAALCSSINNVLTLEFQGEEFTAGLLHDLGRLLLGTMFPDDSQQLHHAQSHESAESLEQEIQISGVDHAVVGCFFAISNRLPFELTEAIRYHHTPELTASTLTATVAVADQVSHQILQSDPSDYEMATNPHLDAFEKNCGLDARTRLLENTDAVLTLGTEIFTSLSTTAAS